ncbi:N-acetylmuramoyl-L-alanine amidase [Micromonospora sp. NPDC049559]|uniref:peptidoglycan recognition protein family protein n=1 Tax=Micromonospora sp. NPDC049559 TaxID=3155923 RepID=UPI003447AC37
MNPQTPHLDRRTLLRTGIGAAAATAVGAAGELALPGAAQAAPAQAATARPAPPSTETVIGSIITNDSWAARPPASPVVMNTGTTQKIVVHHTAYPNSTDYSVNQAIWLARDIQNLHMDGNGWADTGQHFTVSRGGYILEGRHRSLEGLRSGAQQVVAAHSPGENGRGIGIENEGTYITEAPPEALLRSLTDLCVAIATQYRLQANHIFGHWDFQATQCPGITFYRLFPQLRRDVAKRLGTRYSEVPARTWPNIFSSSRGAVVLVAQYLLRLKGYALTPSTTFDAALVAAVEDFQRRNGIEPAGLGEILDSTWDLLVVPLDGRSTGDAVTALQSILAPKGYAVTPTGAFDEATRQAVRQLQKLHGLPVTGRVDLATWCAAVGGIVREEFRGTLRH